MSTLAVPRIKALLTPYVLGAEAAVLTPELLERLAAYLNLLLRWNARTNLSAVRTPEEMVTRHFGESLFAATCLRPHLQAESAVLDLGSGAGFPGIPLQLAIPSCRVTLAESQGKKAAFLREVVRELGVRSEVWGARVEEMPRERRFAAVTLRAVDRMDEMTAVAARWLQPGGVLLRMATARAELQGESFLVPGRRDSYVRIERVGVPRGT